MSHSYAEDLEVEPSLPYDIGALEARGWVSLDASASNEMELCQRILGLASRLGILATPRSGVSFCDQLVPTTTQKAKPHSLSKIHSVGEFPLHTDTAHWLTPCRYVMLACVSPGSGKRPTVLLDTRRLALNNGQISLLHSTPLRVRNGRNSFFSTILSKTRRFVRFDPGCMASVSSDGVAAIEVLSKHNWLDNMETIHWEEGKVLVIDNWVMLHGRGQAACSDFDRKLLRISIR